MTTCATITSSGKRCKAHPIGGSQFCYFHDEKTRESRRGSASRGGRGGNIKTVAVSEEATRIKDQLSSLYRKVERGTVDPRVGAVLAQIANSRLRACEFERRLIELYEIELRLTELERNHRAVS